ncbi:MAG: choice-of-anchor B family protein [Planctomycetes bacterium]|nr:choice-of-anchor B family protein [Planctomycetota bacterium]
MGSRWSIGWVGTTLALGLTATLTAHVDDPKPRDTVPPYMGPGYRSAGAADGGVPLEFDSDGVQLLSWLPISEFPGSHTASNDCWGYVSPTGREYALLGLSAGTGIVEITNPGDPVIVEMIPGPQSSWHDIKVFQNHAYVVSEAGNGIQVIDLTNVDFGVATLVNEITTGGSATHNVAINADSGRLYRTGGSGNGLLIYDIGFNPANPTLIGSWPTRYVHDAQIVTYTSGPWAGKEIAFCCSGLNGGSVETGLDILDVTNPGNIITLGQLIYANGAYSHQAWLSEDRQYLYLNDELDENGVLPTTTFAIDVSNLASPFVAGTFTNGNQSIGHNLYVRGDLIFEANYRSGLRVFDTSVDPLNPVEIAYFDTWIPDDNDNFNGLWSNYPYFPSGVIIGSDIEKGLFVWRLGEPMLAFGFPSGLPEAVAPSGDSIAVEITELQAGGLLPGTATVHVSDGVGGFTTSPMIANGGTSFTATIPATECGTLVDFYFSADASDGFTETSPSLAPSSAYAATSTFGTDVAFTDDMETDPGWAVENVDLTDGGWGRGVPAGAGDRGDPLADFDGSGQCWLTDNVSGNSDVDGGPTRLESPPIDISGLPDPFVSYARWFTNDDNDADNLTVEVSSNGGANWTLVEVVGNEIGWQEHTFRVADFVALNPQIHLRFSATDNPNDSVTEAAIDAVKVLSFECIGAQPADLNQDGNVDFGDILLAIGAWGPCPAPPATCPEDIDGSGAVDFGDILQIIANWTG